LPGEDGRIYGNFASIFPSHNHFFRRLLLDHHRHELPLFDGLRAFAVLIPQLSGRKSRSRHFERLERIELLSCHYRIGSGPASANFL
jgi:hypothetical protein